MLSCLIKAKTFVCWVPRAHWVCKGFARVGVNVCWCTCGVRMKSQSSLPALVQELACHLSVLHHPLHSTSLALYTRVRGN